MGRFVTPQTVQVPLSEGDWVEFKERLTYGEEQRLTGFSFSGIRGALMGEDEVGYDLSRHKIGRLAMWIVDWSFLDDNGKSVQVSEQSIERLDPATAAEIEDALTGHIERLLAERNVASAEALIEKYEKRIEELRERKNGLRPGEPGP